MARKKWQAEEEVNGDCDDEEEEDHGPFVRGLVNSKCCLTRSALIYLLSLRIYLIRTITLSGFSLAHNTTYYIMNILK